MNWSGSCRAGKSRPMLVELPRHAKWDKILIYGSGEDGVAEGGSAWGWTLSLVVGRYLG